jgi:hypothetical protein
VSKACWESHVPCQAMDLSSEGFQGSWSAPIALAMAPSGVPRVASSCSGGTEAT